MFKLVRAIPNYAEQLVAVRYRLPVLCKMGPKAGQVVLSTHAFVGASSCEVDIFEFGDEKNPVAVTWRFWRGTGCIFEEGEDVENLAWDRRVIVVDGREKDARAELETVLGNEARADENVAGPPQDFEWFLAEVK